MGCGGSGGEAGETCPCSIMVNWSADVYLAVTEEIRIQFPARASPTIVFGPCFGCFFRLFF